MSERVCIRGCTVRGQHYAACPDFGREGGACEGCAPVESRDGVMLCNRCYGRIRARLEAVPDLVAHLRSLADPLKAQVYDRVLVQGSASDGSPAPVAADLIDAADNIMWAIGASKLPPGASSKQAYELAYRTIRYLLDTFDVIANDADSIREWWHTIMSVELPERPGFWTVSRALSQWPLEDRRHWAKQPCPDCGLRAVKIIPPRHRHARTWFACSSCGWRKTEKDDDGLWAAAFGQYPRDRHNEGKTMGSDIVGIRDIDVTEAISAGVQHAIEHADLVEKIGTFGTPAAAISGAVPALGEQFALVAEQVADDVRSKYENGDLIAGGARLAAAAIRAAAHDGDTSLLEHLARELGALGEASHETARELEAVAVVLDEPDDEEAAA